MNMNSPETNSVNPTPTSVVVVETNADKPILGQSPNAKSDTNIKTNHDFEPIILAFSCNWCSYTSADLAGVNRFFYPANVRVIRFMCSGRI